MIREFIPAIRALLYNPKKVTLICSLILFMGLLFDGTFLRLWELNYEQNRLQKQLEQLKVETKSLHGQIERIKDPAYVERLARDRFDWVAEDELIFVFDDTEN